MLYEAEVQTDNVGLGRAVVLVIRQQLVAGSHARVHTLCAQIQPLEGYPAATGIRQEAGFY